MDTGYESHYLQEEEVISSNGLYPVMGVDQVDVQQCGKLFCMTDWWL